jgi:hypothetical protein
MLRWPTSFGRTPASVSCWRRYRWRRASVRWRQVVNVRPGFWVLACFMDTQDGREHTRLGMERVIHITK